MKQPAAPYRRLSGVWEIRSGDGQLWLIPATDMAQVAPILEAILREISSRTTNAGQFGPYAGIRYQPPIAEPDNYGPYHEV